MTTRNNDFFEKDSQVLCCYGRRSNTYLMAVYGFCLQNNKYNSLRFKVWVDFTKDEKERMEAFERKRAEKQKRREERKGSSDSSDDSEDDGLDNRVKKSICLKMDSLSEDLLAYFRVTLSQKFEESKRAHILVSTPVDVEFEMLVIACGINLLNDFFGKRFKTTLAEDIEALKNPDLSYNARLCLTNRIDLKRILSCNVKICNVLIHILGKI